MREAVEIFADAAIARENFGVTLFGPDLSQWPAKAYMALTVINRERSRADAIELSTDK